VIVDLGTELHALAWAARVLGGREAVDRRDAARDGAAGPTQPVLWWRQD
jgi:hypothetical protein